jgi:hypothetical protein
VGAEACWGGGLEEGEGSLRPEKDVDLLEDDPLPFPFPLPCPFPSGDFGGGSSSESCASSLPQCTSCLHERLPLDSLYFGFRSILSPWRSPTLRTARTSDNIHSSGFTRTFLFLLHITGIEHGNGGPSKDVPCKYSANTSIDKRYVVCIKRA